MDINCCFTSELIEELQRRLICISKSHRFHLPAIARAFSYIYMAINLLEYQDIDNQEWSESFLIY